MSFSRKKTLLQMLGLLGLAAFFVVIQYSQSGDSTSSRGTERASFSGDSSRANNRVTIYDQSKAFSGYTLYPESGTEEVLLLDMHGHVTQRWKVDAMRARLLPNCNLLVIHGTKWGANREPWKDLLNTVREYDWEGKVVWEYSSKAKIHHDIQRLSNGNTLFAVMSSIPKELRLNLEDQRRRKTRVRSDDLIEIASDGRTVWDWKAHEHLDLNSCGRRPCSEQSPGDWTHLNTVQVLPENKWYEAGDQRFKPGNLLIMLRNWWMAMIIDRDTKEIVWEYEGDYKGGLAGGHEAHMIEPGLPGAGNILIFDNGRGNQRNESYALEINPTNKEVVWVYDVGEGFFSHAAGSLQRLANGNTLISEDVTGRVFEVTAEKELVWEYKGDLRIARAQRYAPGYCEKLS